MDEKEGNVSTHPEGEVLNVESELDRAKCGQTVETFGDKPFVRWNPKAAVTAYEPVTSFLEFLKTNGLWQEWVKDCPLTYRSRNAPPKHDLFGTVLLSVLAAHQGYAHVTTIRSDSGASQLLGMKRVRGEDAVRRTFVKG